MDGIFVDASQFIIIIIMTRINVFEE